jgi:hypothetical protein
MATRTLDKHTTPETHTWPHWQKLASDLPGLPCLSPALWLPVAILSWTCCGGSSWLSSWLASWSSFHAGQHVKHNCQPSCASALAFCLRLGCHANWGPWRLPCTVHILIGYQS